KATTTDNKWFSGFHRLTQNKKSSRRCSAAALKSSCRKVEAAQERHAGQSRSSSNAHGAAHTACRWLHAEPRPQPSNTFGETLKVCVARIICRFDLRSHPGKQSSRIAML